MTVDTCRSDVDTVLGVYTGTSVSALAPVAGSDDACGDGQSRVSFAATAGVTYRIAVDAFAAATGNIVLHVSTGPAPANDDFARAAPIDGSFVTLTATNIGAGAEAGEPLHQGLPGGVSVWWSWTAPASGPVTLDACGSSFVVVPAVYTGPPSARSKPCPPRTARAASSCA